MTYREHFHQPKGAYFLSHSIGLRPQTTDSVVDRYFTNPWRSGDGEAWTHWLEGIERFRQNLAPLLNARATDICPQTNITSALSKILFSLPERPKRKKIYLTEEDFPTVGFAIAQARRIGYDVKFLPGRAHLADPDAWAPAFGDDVQLVHITHVFSNVGVKAPVKELTRRARDNGVFSIVDVAQSTGAVPVDAEAWAADFLTGTSVKYLCGGPGAAYLHVREEIAKKCTPLEAGWFSHETPFDCDIHSFKFAENALRYWGGTPSVAPFVAASAASELLSGIGISKIYEHNQRLISRFLAALPPASVLSHAKENERGSAIIVKPKDLSAASAALFEAGFAHDQRMGGLRLSIHLYTTENEIDALAQALAPLV